MSTAAPLQRRAAKATPGTSEHAGLLIQRKCACCASTTARAGQFEACSAGNRTHPKLTIGAASDPLEQEADRVADAVLSSPALAGVSGGQPRIQRSLGQPSMLAGEAVPASVERVLARPGLSLEAPLRADMEQRFRHDFSRVRVHLGPDAERSARDVGASAYTVGDAIVFGASRFAPGTREGRRLIAHELTHVVQQNFGQHTFMQRTLEGCRRLLANPGTASLISGNQAHRLITTHFRSTVADALSISIPGASAAPLRSQGLCGAPSDEIAPQISGGRAGRGIPDLARLTPGGILQIAEIKPAAPECLVDGEEQMLIYLNQGNARDPEQTAWKAAHGITVVSPMLEGAYSPPNIRLAGRNAELRTAWCAPGLIAYAVNVSGERETAPEPVLVPPLVDVRSRRQAQEYLSEESGRRTSPSGSRTGPGAGVVAAAAAVAVGAEAIAGRALWRHFWRVVIRRFAVRGATALALAAIDGPLPLGDLLSLGLAIVTVYQILDDWNDLWREADQIAAGGA